MSEQNQISSDDEENYGWRQCSTDESLPTTPDVDQFWKLETIGIKPPDDNTDDEVGPKEE